MPFRLRRWVRIPSEANKATRNQFIVSTMMFLAFGASEEKACNAIRLDSDLQVRVASKVCALPRADINDFCAELFFWLLRYVHESSFGTRRIKCRWC